MTTRSPAAVGRFFRRPFLEAFAKYSTSLAVPPHWISDFVSQVSRFSTVIDQSQTSLGYRFRLVVLARQNVHISSVPRAASPNSGPSTLRDPAVEPGGRSLWISTRTQTQNCDVQRAFYSEIPEKKGDSVSVLQNEEINSAGYLDLRRQKLESLRSHIHSHNAFMSRPHAGSKMLNYQLMQMRHYTMPPIREVARWMRITGTYVGPLAPSCVRHPFLDGSVRFKSRNKQKKAKAKKREVLQKIKRMRVVSKKRKEDMNPEEKLEFRLHKGRKKMELIKQAIAKFPVQEIPPEDPDIEVLTAEQRHYLKKIGYKNKNYVPVGRRGIYGGTIQNIHMHWKKHETVQVEIAGFSKEEIKVMADQLARLSGGIAIDIHRNNIVILYRGRNYQMPKQLIPMKTLDKRKALALSKLDQSLKALLENDKKVEFELAALRKERELSGSQVDRGGQESSNIGKEHKLQPAEPKLEDPDEYSEWSLSDEVDVDVDDDDDDDDDSDTTSDSEVSYTSEVSSLLSASDSDTDSDTDSGTVNLEVDKVVEK